MKVNLTNFHTRITVFIDISLFITFFIYLLIFNFYFKKQLKKQFDSIKNDRILSITSYVVYDRFYIKFSKFTFLVSLTIHIFAVIDSLAFYLLITSSLFLFRPFSDLKNSFCKYLLFSMILIQKFETVNICLNVDQYKEEIEFEAFYYNQLCQIAKYDPAEQNVQKINIQIYQRVFLQLIRRNIDKSRKIFLMREQKQINLYIRITVSQKQQKLYLTDVKRIKKMRRKTTPLIPQFHENIVSGKDGKQNYQFTSDEEIKEVEN